MKNENWLMKNDHKRLKVALVCDWLTNQGGAERVVLELHKMFPDAPIYTSVYDPRGPGMDKFAGADVKQSFIRFLPWAKSRHQLYPVLRRWAFTRWDFSQFDLVISSSGAEAKGIITNPEDRRWQIADRIKGKLSTNYQMPTTKKWPLHISYCHSPTHYYWVRPDEYLQSEARGWFGKLLRVGLKLLIKPMRRLDYLAAQRPDFIIANSTLTKDRIKRFYDRDSEVIFPPVETERFTPPAVPPIRKGFVSLGRQVHYMRRDIAVEACRELGLLLRVIGRGPEHEYLRSLAGQTVEFYEDLSDEEVAEALWHAEGLITCGIEDFGLTAVEALAAGCPVIALQGGGVEDIIIPGQTGELFSSPNINSLQAVLKDFSAGRYDQSAMQKHAKRFDSEVFHQKIHDFLAANLK